VIKRPRQFTQAYAEAFQDRSVADAYRYRPPYPPDVFGVLLGLINTRPRLILDVGCGTGNLARPLVASVERLDALDCSREMIEHGRQLPNGDHPHLRWIKGRAEDAALDSSYALVAAGESLPWMDWSIVLPRFHQVLAPAAYLAIVTHDTTPDAWSILGEIVPRYRVDGGFEPFDMIGQLGQHSLFEVVGEQIVGPIQFRQSIDDFIESYHSRSGFSRERMGASKAAAFDEEARELLLKFYGDALLSLQVTASVVWGFPRG
jgi:SAM-dependent methyltransferase